MFIIIKLIEVRPIGISQNVVAAMYTPLLIDLFDTK